MSAIIQKNGLPSYSEEALINQLKGLQSSELDAFIQRNIFQLSQINDCAKKALESLPNSSTNYTSDGLFTNINDQIDQLENEDQRDTIKSQLENCIRVEDSRLKERFGLIFGSIASIISGLFGTIGETHKIIASIAAASIFANSALSSNRSKPKQKLEFETASIPQFKQIEYGEL